MSAGVHTTLDSNTTIKPSLFTQTNSDAIVDGLNQNASQSKQFAPRLIPGWGSGGVEVRFNPTGTLDFPRSGRSYLVTLSWAKADGQFLPFGPVSQQPNCSNKSLIWMREDSRTNDTQIVWEVYVPTGPNYVGASATASFCALGNWSNAQNISPTCNLSVSDPLP